MCLSDGSCILIVFVMCIACAFEVVVAAVLDVFRYSHVLLN